MVRKIIAALLLIFWPSCLLYGQMLQAIVNSTAAAAGEPTFTRVQGKQGSFVSSGTTVTVTLTGAPTAGNAVVCRISAFPVSMTLSTIVDNAGTPNSYTVTPHSPSNTQSGATGLWLAYLLNVPASPGATITATFTGGPITFNSSVACNEWHRSFGSWTFDTDVAGSGASGTAITVPSITPSVAGELLYSGVVIGGGPFITAYNSPWTEDQAGHEPTNDAFSGADVLAGASGSTTISYTISGSGTWNGLVMALK